MRNHCVYVCGKFRNFFTSRSTIWLDGNLSFENILINGLTEQKEGLKIITKFFICRSINKEVPRKCYNKVFEQVDALYGQFTCL